MKTKGYPRSWYPIARSCELKLGQHQPVRAFGKDWVVFRGDTGEVGCLSRLCVHMGADLCQGGVCGGAITCPLHGWRFGRTGMCEQIPALDETPSDIVSTHLPCEEKFGIIFVFWGSEPEYDLPFPPEMEGTPTCSRVYCIELASEHHSPCLNTFDLQHFERIHNRHFKAQPKISSLHHQHLQIAYEAQIIKRRWPDYVMNWISSSTTRVIIDCWGASQLMLLNRDTGIGGIVTMLPIEREYSRVFILAMKRHRDGNRWSHRLLDGIAVTAGSLLMRGFLHPDLAALTNMRPYSGRLIAGLDDAAKEYWDYWEQLPRWQGPPAVQED
ncbi:MAG: Rieske (2Fe-2S) protein [Candidatus Thiodiazotropha endolucinida]